MSDYLFSFQNVNVDALYVFDNIVIPKEKVTFVVGDPDAGRAFCKLLNGTVQVASGKILFLGKDLSEIDKVMLKNQVVMVNQPANVFDFTVKENFEAFYEFNHLILLDDDEMASILKLVFLDKNLQDQVTDFTSEERAKLYLAVHLTLFPQVILLEDMTEEMALEDRMVFYEGLIQYCKKNDIELIISCKEIEIIEKYQEEILTLD